ncbi:MAG: DsbA family protein [Anaerolineae bacterium]|nr:DsbA family protein [Anaerolineae bacterium]
MEKLQKKYDIDVIWHSYELRPKGSPSMSAEQRATIESAQPRLAQIARDAYQLELNSGPFGIDSRAALIGAKFAEEQGHGPAYHALTLKGYWQQGLDISQVETLRQIAAQAGLDPEAFEMALENPACEQQVEDDIRTAHAYGLNGVPALVFAEKYLVMGAQPYEALAGVIEQIRAETGE